MIPIDQQYPGAEIVEWGWSESNRTYYRGTNKPAAIVVHVMQGWARTGVDWAKNGHQGASWHFTVGRDGKVYQHLRFVDGGYHAGIGAEKPTPSWKLWRGYATNVNNYTIGIEHEGFTGEPFPDAQIEASAALARWLCEYFGFPADRDHIVGHYEIDRRDRPNDPGPTFPWERYMRLAQQAETEEELMTKEQIEEIVAAKVAETLNARGFESNFAESVTRRFDAIHDAIAGHADYPAAREEMLAAVDLWTPPGPVTPNTKG